MQRKKHFGKQFQVDDYTGWIHQEFAYPELVNRIKDCAALLADPAAELLHMGRNRIGAVSLDSSSYGRIELVIKEFGLQGWNRWKTLLIPSKAAKAWRGGNLLQAAGISTPAPIAYLEKKKRGTIEACYYLACKTAPGKEIREYFLCSPENLPVGLLPALAGFLAGCHAAGILHRDLSDGNVMVVQSREGSFAFTLLDTNRIRARKHINILARIKNLIRLGIPPERQRSFLAAYLGCQDVPSRLWAWYRLNKRAFTGYIALKKRLRLKQIAKRLKLQ